MVNSFRRGIHPPHNKTATQSLAIVRFPVPERVSVPLSQHIGAPSNPVVAVGDTVRMGSLLAEAGGFVGARIFSPVSGVVEAIADQVTLSGRKAKHIVIKNDFADTAEFLPPLTEPTREQLVARARESGIVGMGGAGFPLSVKLSPRKPVDTVVINAAECEPYITCDYRIMLERTEDLVRGIGMLASAVDATDVIIGIEDNKSDCVEVLRRAIRTTGVRASVCLLATKYPQGAEKQLIFATTGRAVPQGGLPSDVGVNVHNVHTALAFYEAVALGKPLYERIMTVTGHACKEPCNAIVRNGTPISFLLEQVGVNVTEQELNEAKQAYELAQAALDEAAKEKKKTSALVKTLRLAKKKYKTAQAGALAKMINGGPMMGAAFSDARATTTKTASCLLLLTHADADRPDPSPCINCGRCARACPMSLMPMYIDAYTLVGDWAGAKKYGAVDCISCGCCSYVCPAKRPLTQSFAYAKKMIKEKGV